MAAVSIALWSDRRTRSAVAEERRLALEREQLVQAYSVRVINAQGFRTTRQPAMGDLAADGLDMAVIRMLHEEPAWLAHPAVVIVNRGSYTITRIEVRFSGDDGGIMVPVARRVRLLGFAELPKRLREGLEPGSDAARYDTLTPWDTGLCVRADPVEARQAPRPLPLVRWTDQWGVRWEHNRGVVRRLHDAAASW